MQNHRAVECTHMQVLCITEGLWESLAAQCKRIDLSIYRCSAGHSYHFPTLKLTFTESLFFSSFFLYTVWNTGTRRQFISVVWVDSHKKRSLIQAGDWPWVVWKKPVWSLDKNSSGLAYKILMANMSKLVLWRFLWDRQMSRFAWHCIIDTFFDIIK